MDCDVCGKELKYTGDPGAHLWQLVHLLNHVAADLHDLVDALGDREQGDPGWILYQIGERLEEMLR